MVISIFLHGWKDKMFSNTVWLEIEHFEESKKISSSVTGEVNRWKTYLNALALLGFEQWLMQKNPGFKINREKCSIFQDDKDSIIDVVYNLVLGKFNLCLIVVDSLIDDFVNIPPIIITSPKLAAHFYVLLEVLEEEEKLNIHGFLRYDQIAKNYHVLLNQPRSNDIYQIPLTWFDYEINNLLLSINFSQPNNLALLNKYYIENKQNKVTFKLSNWLKGIFEQGWEDLIDNIIFTADFGYARSINKLSTDDVGKSKYKPFLINGERFALIVVIQKLESNNEIDVLVRVCPQTQQYLPANLKLKITLNPDTADSESQEVIAREMDIDNAIQLELSDVPGTQFRVDISYGNVVITEEFEF